MAGAATAERITTETFLPPPPEQEYAHSTATLANWGAQIIVQKTVAVETIDTPEKGLSYDDYESSLREMLTSDKRFGKVLNIDDKREHQIIDGQFCDRSGQPMIDTIHRGKLASQELARQNPVFEGLAVRDASDEAFAEKADNLELGQALIGVSMKPVEDLKKHTKTYEKLGFGDIAFIQWYAKGHDGIMTAGSYSIEAKDEAEVMEWMTKQGFEIPEGTDPNTFLQHSLEVTATAEQVEQQVIDMRDEYYKMIGNTHKRYSVSEYLAQNRDTAEGFFNAYYPSLAKAAHTNKNNKVMKDFALAIVNANIKKLSADVTRNLIRVANSDGFDAEAVKTMDSILRYAVVEDLRKGLGAFTEQEAKPTRPAMTWARTWNDSPTRQDVDFGFTNERLVNNLSSGVNAGRSYGGCPGQIDPGEDSDKSKTSGNNGSQSAYDRNAIFTKGEERERWQVKNGKCVVPGCPTSPKEVKVGPCGVCMDRCQKLYDSGKDAAKIGKASQNISKVFSRQLKPEDKVSNSNTSDKKLTFSLQL